MPTRGQKTEKLALTKKWNRVVWALYDNVKISEPSIQDPDLDEVIDGNEVHSFDAIWDTGATNTLISNRVVNRVNIEPIRLTTIETANGVIDSEVSCLDK